MNADSLISVTDLKKYYKGEKIKALDGVSAEIKKGEVVVVIGPSGSGKSTFLRCLNLLEVPTAGQILFNGVDITDPKTNIDLHRQKMGMSATRDLPAPESPEMIRNSIVLYPRCLLGAPRRSGDRHNGRFNRF